MRALLAIVLSSLLLASTASAAKPDSSRDGGRRIRPQDERTIAMMAAGMVRSASFRALVARVEASDVFVYVGISPLLKSSLAGRLTWMTQAGGFRYLRAVINTELSSDHMISAIAHELQHAVEVIEDAGVADERSLEALYKRIGKPSNAVAFSAWETVAAQDAGIRVRRELNAPPATVALRALESDEL